MGDVITEVADHILICFHDFNRGGTERIAIGMAKRWVELGRRVTILCGARQGGLEDTVDPQIEVQELSPPIARSPISRLQLGHAMARRIAAIAPDIIFLPGNFHFPLIPALGKARGRAALVAKISNPAVPQGLTALPIRWLLARVARHLDGFAAMNHGLEQEIRAIAPHTHVTTLYDPVYLADTPLTPRSLPLPGPAAIKEIVWAGRFEPQKDVPLALRTIAELNRHMPARLTMLGDGYLRPKMEALAAKMRLGEQVRFIGHVPSIDPYLAQADALLVSSVYEGGPAVAVEALAHGVPVVFTPCSHFLRDIMTTPQAGRIAADNTSHALADALAQVCAAPRPGPEMLRSLIAHLAPEPCSDAYLAWFDAMVTARRAMLSDKRPHPVDESGRRTQLG